MQMFCPNCGSKIEYSLVRPTTCPSPKCGKSLSAAFKVDAKQFMPVAEIDIDELVERKINERIAKQMSAGGIKQPLSKPRHVAPARKGKLIKDDNGEEYYEDEDGDNYDEDQAKITAEEIAASLDPSTMFEPIGHNPLIIKFGDLVEEAIRNGGKDNGGEQ